MDSHIEFKRKIDSARNILVGAVPSPAGQIDQITYALIYKFMSDIDDKSARLPGGTRQYFVDEYEKYDWHNLMRLDGQDKLNRYRDALSAMSKNKHLPEIFRSIYQNAFLPYNDPRTLNLFLKEIDGFVHTKSDAIGDAYEYLLSITGAQGDVGQFRTPRHIIKFIVDVVQPGKDDTVLDPACGTAGFLIAAYNYVRMQHDGVGEDGEQNGEQRLTADERKKLHGNYYGYDIDPTMVRTATVNMYLHGFSTPNIEIHDTLTSEEHWQNRYDVILANPPFMTPKGGIQPHGKFGVKANRAEVLFVDYIASHLKPNGRAGIIVPEGIIFQSGNAYKELRKSLVENSLYAVISLPSGVFNPYAGVKTSILLLDKELAAKNNEILFVKIENDGYSLGAQRRKMAGDQFPEALEVIERFKNGEELQTEFAHAVPRKQVAESDDYNLSGDRSKIVTLRDNQEFPMVEIHEIADVRDGTHDSPKYVPDEGYPLVTSKNLKNGQLDFTDVNLISKNDLDAINKRSHVDNGDILVPMIGTIGGAVQIKKDREFAIKNVALIKPRDNKVDMAYICAVMNSEYVNNLLINSATGGTQKFISLGFLRKLKIPLPPIEIQREIVAELDGYQKIIDAAQTIVQTYKPTIKINPEWEIASLGDYVSVNNGQVLTEFDADGKNACIKVGDMNLPENSNSITTSSHWTNKTLKGLVEVDSVLFPKRGAAIATNKKRLSKIPCYIDNNCMAITVRDKNKLCSSYLYYFMLGFDLTSISNSAGVALINNPDIKGVKIPLPPIEIQREIVAELEAEQKLVDANKKLIEIYQQKIKSKIAEVWGE